MCCQNANFPGLHAGFQIERNLNERPLNQQPQDWQSNSISSLPVTKSLETPPANKLKSSEDSTSRTKRTKVMMMPMKTRYSCGESAFYRQSLETPLQVS